MQVQYKLKLGRDEFLLNFDVKNEKEFFEQAAFYSNLPRTAPGGSDDLKIVFRKTKKGHRYYSLISEVEKKEYKFGQQLEANGNGLFGKGWEEAYATDGEEGEDNQGQGVGIGVQTQQQAPAQQQAPVGIQTAPAQTPAPAAKAAAPAAFKMPTPITQAPVQQQAPAPAAVATQTVGIGATQTVAPAAQPTVSPAVAKVSTDVLKRFGIQTNR